MDDGAFTRQRRSLNIVSIALIVFFGAGGDIPDGLVISTFGITLANKSVAIVFIGIAFFYFWYRFKLFGRETKRAWHIERHFELSKHKKYQELVQKLKYKNPKYLQYNEQSEYLEFNQSPDRTPKLIRSMFSRHIVQAPQFITKKFLKDWLSSYGDVSSVIGIGLTPTVKIPLTDYFVPATRAYFSAANKYTSWSDYALPLFLAWLALGCAIFFVSRDYLCSTTWINQCTW